MNEEVAADIRKTIEGLRATGTRTNWAIAALLESQCEHIQYLEESLVAATTGELPAKYDLNQMLLAQRAKGYVQWIMNNKDPRDKVVKE